LAVAGEKAGGAAAAAAAVPQPGLEGQAAEFNGPGVITIAVAHWIHDSYTAFLAPLLIIFKQTLSLSNTEAGLLSVFMQEASLAQPLIGGLADRFSARYFVILSPAVTGIFMSLLGIAPSYLALAIMLTIVGISSACMHATGPVMTGNLSGRKLGLGMSIWMVGGEAGRFVGPLAIGFAIPLLTLQRVPWMMVVGILATIVLAFTLKGGTGQTYGSQGPKTSLWTELGRKKAILPPLLGFIVVHVFMSAALVTYLPLLLHEEGESFWFASMSLAVLQGAGVVGAMAGGTLSDRLGRRWLLFAAVLPTSIFMFAFLAAGGWLRFPLLLLLGFTSLSITPVVMALVQENFPNNRALANGFYMALSFVVRSLVVVLLGLLGDRYGLRLSFVVSAIVPLFGLPLLALLPGRTSAGQGGTRH
jgi:MFS transporter, FSR family, fosmidomycin resistance protein